MASPNETATSDIDPELTNRIEAFSEFMTALLSGNNENFHALFGRVMVNGKQRSTARQATSFVRPFGGHVKATIRQNPDSNLGEPSPFPPVEIALFKANDTNASQFIGGVVQSTMTGDGGLFGRGELPIIDANEFGFTTRLAGDILGRLGIPRPAEIFPSKDASANITPPGLVIPRY